MTFRIRRWSAVVVTGLLLALASGCSLGSRTAAEGTHDRDAPGVEANHLEQNGGNSAHSEAAERHGDDPGLEGIPALEPVQLAEGERLRVVATTSIVGDVVAQVGGEMIDLVVLMGPGQDPHTYQPSAEDLAKAEGAHVIFVNGYGFEEGLLRDLERAAAGTLMVPVSTGIEPIEREVESDTGEPPRIDPHVWFDVQNVRRWTHNIEHVLSELDRSNAERYQENVEVYEQELEELDAFIEERVERIPADRRKLVTNHDTFAYFARAYGFEVIGTVIPGFSTGVEPSAASLSELVETIRKTKVPAIFVETTLQEPLAEVVAEETGAQVYQLHTDALGVAGSGAESYVGLMRSMIEVLVEALAR